MDFIKLERGAYWTRRNEARENPTDVISIIIDGEVHSTLFSLYSILLYSTLLYSNLLYSTLLNSTLLYPTLLYSTLLDSTTLL